MKRYEGKRQGSAALVTVDGFEWGYAGSGPAQLALALLADCLGDDDEAIEGHHDFKDAVVAGLSHSDWTLTDVEIRETLTAMENE